MEGFIRSRQQLFSTLVGTVLTLGISVASAGDPSWRYDADTDRTFYSFSGPEIRNSDVTDNADPKAPTLSWYYDADSDRIFDTFGGSDIHDSN